MPTDQYLWTSIGVLPNGDALAGGELSSNGAQYPVVAHVSCNTAPTVVAFPALSGVPTISSVVVNADNDAWAATAGAPGQLYHLTDGQPPHAPAGNDLESRPVVPQPVQTVYVVSPTPTARKRPKHHTRYVHKRTKHLKAAIYAVRTPPLRKVNSTTFILEITFRVRRPVFLGARALRHGKVVSSAPMKRFTPPRGELKLTLRRTAWPTKIEFVQPPPNGAHG
jgi:hypothetical protein